MNLNVRTTVHNRLQEKIPVSIEMVIIPPN